MSLSEAEVAARGARRFRAGFAPAEQLRHLELTERLPLAWHSMTDEEVAAVTAALWPERLTVSLMSAIAYFDVNDRLEEPRWVPLADDCLPADSLADNYLADKKED